MKLSTHLGDSHRETEAKKIHTCTVELQPCLSGRLTGKFPLPSVTFSVAYYPILPMKATIDIRPSTDAKMACSLTNWGGKLQKK